MQGRGRIIAHDFDMWANADATDEEVERLYGLLQVEHPCAAFFIGITQLGFVVGAAHADPSAAVVGLDVEREAELAADFADVEIAGIVIECALDVRVGAVLFRRHQPGLGNR
ncbi:MAG: hypothetical protein CO108_28805 [Deltaproteobacteria bacterium CG_4_9_14_3_um_filter_63_12]|nr:MAG: hypothetical protein CO108_28805 [Deltaproteobacteria bacterium CG_4_9_14_3_um_filter_63_12]